MQRIEAIELACVRNVRAAGIRVGKWLDPKEVSKLLAAPDVSRLKGKRDRALLGVLIVCGLRRDELVRLTVNTCRSLAGAGWSWTFRGRETAFARWPCPPGLKRWWIPGRRPLAFGAISGADGSDVLTGEGRTDSMPLSQHAQYYADRLYRHRVAGIEEAHQKSNSEFGDGLVDRKDAETRMGRYALIEEEIQTNRKKAELKAQVLVEAYEKDGVELSEDVVAEIMSQIGLHLEALNSDTVIREKQYLDDLNKRLGGVDGNYEERLAEVSGRVAASWKAISDRICDDLELKMSELRLRKNKDQSGSRVVERVDESAKVRRVWVVHGRDERLRRGVFDFLRSIGLEPLEFSEARKLTGKPMPYVGEILHAAFQHAQAVVVLLTPDDEARLRPELQKEGDPDHERVLFGQARPNVIFEAGMALVSHPEQTLLVQFGIVRPFSDVTGRHIVHMDGSGEKRQELASRLEDAGCPVNLSGTDWHRVGDMKPRVDLIDSQSKSSGVVEAAAEANVNQAAKIAARSITDATRNLQKAARSFYSLHTQYLVARAVRDIANEEKEISETIKTTLAVFAQDYDLPTDLAAVVTAETGNINIALEKLFSNKNDEQEMEIAATQIQDACDRIRAAARPYAYGSSDQVRGGLI